MSFNDDWGGSGQHSTWNTPANTTTSLTPNTTTTSTTAALTPNENESFIECHSLVTKNIQQLASLYDEIKGNLQLLGKRNDNKNFRDSVNEKIGVAQKLLKDTQAQLKRLDSIATNSQRQKEKKQKVIKLKQDIDSKLEGPFQQLILQARRLMDEIAIPVASIYNNNSPSDERNPLLNEGYQQYFKVADETAFQDGLIHEREREIAGIQRQVVEVNEIFRDLGRMIAEQSPQIERIEGHISDVVGNVKIADSEVTEANELHKKSRNKLCFIALGLVVVVAIIVIIVVVVLKARGTI